MKKFFEREVPGLIRAYTWRLALAGAVMAFAMTRRWTAVFGAVLIVFGDFLGTQANHLAQENHVGERLGWLESYQQAHQTFFQVLGLLFFILGFWMLF